MERPERPPRSHEALRFSSQAAQPMTPVKIMLAARLKTVAWREGRLRMDARKQVVAVPLASNRSPQSTMRSTRPQSPGGANPASLPHEAARAPRPPAAAANVVGFKSGLGAIPMQEPKWSGVTGGIPSVNQGTSFFQDADGPNERHICVNRLRPLSAIVMSETS
jgi:hypothetical protein